MKVNPQSRHVFLQLLAHRERERTPGAGWCPHPDWERIGTTLKALRHFSLSSVNSAPALKSSSQSR
ncbi:MAG: hypothetical protein QM813_19115 [Verrucomicrobiota bacterium]